MTDLRLAAVQLDFVPNIKAPSGARLVDESLAPSDPIGDYSTDNFLTSIERSHRSLKEKFHELRKATRASYGDWMAERIRHVLTHCLEEGVDIVVLPEYSIPPTQVETLLSFSSRLTIVAGLGQLIGQDMKPLRDLDIEMNDARAGMNAAVLFSSDSRVLITKKRAAEHERIEEGTGPKVIPVKLGDETVRVAVAICLDYIHYQGELADQGAQIFAIPALSATSEPFKDPGNNAPAAIRVVSNHAAYGGTALHTPAGILGPPRCIDSKGSVPLPPKVDGIVVVDWNLSQPMKTKPRGSSQASNHRIHAHGEFVSSGLDPSVAEQIKQLCGTNWTPILERGTPAPSIELDSEVLADRFPLLVSDLEVLASIDLEDPEIDDINVYLRRFVFPSESISLDEWRYGRRLDVARAMGRMPAGEGLRMAAGIYDDAAADVSRLVRSTRRRSRDLVSRLPADADHTEQVVAVARLGAFSDRDASRSLPRQLSLLRTIADLQDPNLVLRYRYLTRDHDRVDKPAYFEIICTTSERNEEELASLREGLGQQIGATFAGSYSLTFGADDNAAKFSDPDLGTVTPYIKEIQLPTVQESAVSTAEVADWGLVVDLMRALKTHMTVELQCFSLPSSTEGRGVREVSPDHSVPALPVGADESTAPNLLGEVISSLAPEAANDRRRLGLRVLVGGVEELPESVPRLVAAVVSSEGNYEIIDDASARIDSAHDSRLSQSGRSPLELLCVFHPPAGYMYLGGVEREGASFPVEHPSLPLAGVMLGRARMRKARADKRVDIRQVPKDRTRHVYVVGKTGRGKTNLLKYLAQQDVGEDGPAVIAIDPHGELVEHILHQAHSSRLDGIQLVDLADDSAVPVINPLDVGDASPEEKDQVIQDIIALLATRDFHQWSGPRGDSWMRLALRSMLDPGYPVRPSLADVAPLLRSKARRANVARRMKDPELRRQWQAIEDQARDPEFHSVVDHVAAKFDDLTASPSVRAVLSGRNSTVDLRTLASERGILLLRLPSFEIGQRAAEFLGALILLELRSSVMRSRARSGDRQQVMVYVDEFQAFAISEFDTLVAEARKFGIGFVLAHQNLEQLRAFDRHTGGTAAQLIGAVLGNVATSVIFGVGATDAAILGPQLDISKDALRTIAKYDAIAKVLAGDQETNAFTLSTVEAAKTLNPSNLDYVMKKMLEGPWKSRRELIAQADERLARLEGQNDDSGSGSTRPPPRPRKFPPESER